MRPMRREATTDNASLKKGDMARAGLLGDLLIRAAQKEGYDSTGIFSCSVGDGFEDVYHGVECLSMFV